jgi:hypothetical protein
VKSRKFNPGRKLGFQQLESRMLMSGDVTVAVKHGALVVTGDNSDNRIEITQVGDGQYQVANYSSIFYGDTSINGQSTPQTFSGVTGDFKINFKNGDNYVAIYPQPGGSLTLPGNLRINFGSTGSDGAELDSATVAGGVFVNGQSANVLTSLENCNIGSANFNGGRNDVKVNLGSGQGTLTTIDNSVERDVSFIGSGAGLQMQNTHVGRDLSLKSKGDRGDAISLYKSAVGRNASFHTGDGNDEIQMDGLTVGGKLKILTGGGDDTVALGGFNANMYQSTEAPSALTADQVYVDLGNGNNTLQFGGNEWNGQVQTGGGVIANKATYLAGNGVDQVMNESGQALFGSFTGFEIVPHMPIMPLPIVPISPVAAL